MKAMRPSLLVLVLCAALSAATYTFVLHPRLRQLHLLSQELVRLSSQTVDYRGIEARLTLARSQLKRVRRVAAAMRDRFVTRTASDVFLAELLRSAQESGADVQQARPGEVRPGDPCDILPIELALDCSYPDLLRLFQHLNSLNRPYSVDGLSVRTGDSRGTSHVVVRLGVFLLKEKLSI
ncbi:MAG: type 4a pilus biogenesis protein PilO [Candidatus Eisenbacteria bacterium]|nr:type 4a pilus biogenesis protein PilO [Candidatus Eisenbacteria bacterium]